MCKNWFLIRLSVINIFYLWMWFYVLIYVKSDYNLYDVINICYLWNMILCIFICECALVSLNEYFFVNLILCSYHNSYWCFQWLNKCLMWCFVYVSFSWCIYDYVLLFQRIKFVIKCNCVDILTSLSFDHYVLVFDNRITLWPG